LNNYYLSRWIDEFNQIGKCSDGMLNKETT